MLHKVEPIKQKPGQYLCVCGICGKSFFKRKLIKGNKNTFCSMECSNEGFKLTMLEKIPSKQLDFIEKAKLKHNNFYSYERVVFVNTKIKVEIICPEHGVFKQDPKSHLKHGCSACVGLKRYTRNEIISKFESIHGNKFDYSLFQYNGLNTISTIICPEHGEYQQSPQNHLISKTGCRACSGVAPWTNTDIDNELSSQNRNIKRVGNCDGVKHPLEWQCLTCEYAWFAAPYDVISASPPTGCASCSGRVKLTNEIVDKRLALFDDGRYLTRISNVNEFDSRTKTKNETEWLCKTCDYKWIASTNCILNGEVGCPNCANSAPLSNDIIDKRLIEENLKIKRLGYYSNNHTNIEFECLTCNHIWNTCTKVIFNIGSGCPVCNTWQVNEPIVYAALKEAGLNFIFQQTIADLSSNETKKYRIDFYFPLQKIAIEYNGAQHYHPVKFGGSSQEIADDKFVHQLKRDAYLKNFCQTNDITLIEIDGKKYQNNRLKKYLETELIPFLKENIK